MATRIAGKGLGGISARVTTDDPRVIELLTESERVSFGRHARQQGAGTRSGTWWCGGPVVRAVERLLEETAE